LTALPFEITPQDLAARQASGDALAVLDVREPWELEIARFAGSIDVPLATLPGRLDALPRDRLLVVVCHHGMRSAQATHWLRRQGVENAVNLAGGIDGWARTVDPATPTY
jgi:rhodanese-related sulfurtransferase